MKLVEVVAEAMRGDGSVEYYLDLVNREVVGLPLEVIYAWEEGREVRPSQRELLAKVEDVYSSDGRYARIPRLGDRDLLAVMMDMYERETDPRLKEEIMRSITLEDIATALEDLFITFPEFYDEFERAMEAYSLAKAKEWLAGVGVEI